MVKKKVLFLLLGTGVLVGCALLGTVLVGWLCVIGCVYFVCNILAVCLSVCVMIACSQVNILLFLLGVDCDDNNNRSGLTTAATWRILAAGTTATPLLARARRAPTSAISSSFPPSSSLCAIWSTKSTGCIGCWLGLLTKATTRQTSR